MIVSPLLCNLRKGGKERRNKQVKDPMQKKQVNLEWRKEILPAILVWLKQSLMINQSLYSDCMNVIL